MLKRVVTKTGGRGDKMLLLKKNSKAINICNHYFILYSHGNNQEIHQQLQKL